MCASVNHSCYWVCLQVVPECSSVSYNLAFLAWGSFAFPWYGTGIFFWSPLSLNTFPSPCIRVAHPRVQSVCHFSLASQGLFGGKKIQFLCCSQGDDTYLSLATILALLAVSFKCWWYLGAALSNFRYFLHTWRMPHSSSEFLLQF